MNDIVSIELKQGEDFELEIGWEDEEGSVIPLQGYSAKMQFRKNAGDPDIYLEASTENGLIVVDTEEDVFRINIPAESINNLNFINAEADMFIHSPGGKSFKLFSSRVLLTRRVTV